MAFERTLRFLIIFQTPIAVTIAVWAEPIVNLVLGPTFDQSADVLRGLAPLVFIQGFGPLASVTVNYLGEARRRVPIVLGCVLLNLTLVYALVDQFGVVGAAIAVDISSAVYVVAHLWICTRVTALRLRRQLKTAIRVIPAASAQAGVLIALGTDHLQSGRLDPGTIVRTCCLHRATRRHPRALGFRVARDARHDPSRSALSRAQPGMRPLSPQR